MSPGRVPEDRTSGLTGGPQPRPASADGAEAAASAAPASRFPRLQALAGLTVRGSDGRTVGRVRDIYQQDASGGLAAITVMPRQLSSRAVLVPAVAIETLPSLGTPHDAPRRGRSAGADTGSATDTAADADTGSVTDTGADEEPVVRLRVDAATARAGKRPPETAHVTPQQMREAAEALGLEAAEHPGDPAEPWSPASAGPRNPASAGPRGPGSADGLDSAETPHPVEPR